MSKKDHKIKSLTARFSKHLIHVINVDTYTSGVFSGTLELTRVTRVPVKRAEF